ncbi:MAG: hypothetical protein GTO63_15500 [Anaerolineae bacterium]|nr:hypothetical protein [Anaerolineae bacterium]NIN96232.1 hypothetical protein [Anaerolineae bacterium]NIQ79253.1 hypothetical protein [Anaerolineae bacterium]
MGMGPPTGPTAPELTKPNELYLYNRLQCNALYHNLGYDIEIFWTPRRYVTLPDGRLGWIGCSANPGATYVKCDERWVNDSTTTSTVLNEVAAHETCHISGDMREPPSECMAKALDRCRL